MAEFRLRPRAETDLEDIGRFTKARWSQTQADTYVGTLFDAFDRLVATPYLGQALDEVRGGYRKYRVASHVVFYRVQAYGVEIVRVLHARMDFAAKLRERD